MDNPEVLCAAPWKHMTFAENRYRPCCRIVAGTYKEFPSSLEELMTLVNSKFMKELRRRVHANDIGGMICENCARSGMNEPLLYDYHVTDPHLLGRIDRTREDIRNGTEVLDIPPIELGFSLPGVCNIHCKMCTVHSFEKRGRTRKGKIFIDEAKTLLSQIGFGNVATLLIAGGEPLFNPDTLDLMKFAADRLHPESVLSTVTNGKTINKHIDLLKRFPNLAMNISVDATEDAYELIRLGIKWDHILNNMRLVSETSAQMPHWDIGINTVLMRSGIPCLPDMVKLFLELGFTPNFAPIFGDFYDENIYWYGGLLNGTDWENDFDEAISIARRFGKEAVADELLFRKEELHRHVNGSKIGYYRASPDKFKRFAEWCEEQFSGKDIALLGMTEEIGYFLYYYHSVNTSFRITRIALLEDVPDQVSSVIGIPLVTPEFLGQGSEPILVSCESRSYERYLKYAEDHYDTDRIATLSADIVEASVDKALEKIGSAPVILFGAGGFSRMLLKNTHLSKANIVAYADNDRHKWDTTFAGKPIIAPKDIPDSAQHVIICSRAYEYEIASSLQALHGDAIMVHKLFL